MSEASTNVLKQARDVPPPTQRRWGFRFSLRMFLGTFTVVAIALGYTLNEARRQKEIVEQLSRMDHASYGTDGGKKPAWLPDAFDLSRVGRIVEMGFRKQSVNDVSIVGNFYNLRSLHINYVTATDFSALARLRRLETLRFTDVPISDLTALSQLANLQTLIFHNSRISDVSALAHLTNLKSLHLYGTQVSDVTPLGGLKSLKYLNLSHTPIYDVTALGDLKNLQEFYLNGTRIGDISPLRNLKNLERLEISLLYSQIADLSVLKDLPKLKHLDVGLYGLQLSEEDENGSNLRQHRHQNGVYNVRLLGKDLQELQEMLPNCTIRPTSATLFNAPYFDPPRR